MSEQCEPQLMNCPKCKTPPETRNWVTYCPTCHLAGPFGETPDECEANWNAMIQAMSQWQVAPTDTRYCELEDHARTIERELNQWREVLKDFCKEPDPESILAELDYRDRQIEKWREVAGRLAKACSTSYDATEWPADGTSEQEQAAAAYDALAKLLRL